MHSAENKVVGVAAEYAYDYLMLAIGAAKMKPQGVEHTLSIGGTPEVSLEIRDRWTLIEKGEGHIAVGFGGNPKDPSGVRGGPAFELLFNIHILLSKKRLRDEFRLTQRGHDIAAHAAGEPEREDDQAHLSILCVMDTGNGPAFVYRGRKRQLMLPLPVVGHWMKKGWGKYARLSKLGKVPHLPGM